MDNYIERTIEQSIDKCVAVNGIEGTEDIIYTAYAGCQVLREKYLKVFYKKYSFFKKS